MRKTRGDESKWEQHTYGRTGGEHSEGGHTHMRNMPSIMSLRMQDRRSQDDIQGRLWRNLSSKVCPRTFQRWDVGFSRPEPTIKNSPTAENLQKTYTLQRLRRVGLYVFQYSVHSSTLLPPWKTATRGNNDPLLICEILVGADEKYVEKKGCSCLTMERVQVLSRHKY